METRVQRGGDHFKRMKCQRRQKPTFECFCVFFSVFRRRNKPETSLGHFQRVLLLTFKECTSLAKQERNKWPLKRANQSILPTEQTLNFEVENTFQSFSSRRLHWNVVKCNGSPHECMKSILNYYAENCKRSKSRKRQGWEKGKPTKKDVFFVCL